MIFCCSVYRSYSQRAVERLSDRIAPTARPLVVACLLLIPLGCMQTSTNGPASERLGPGMARIDALIDGCTFTEDPYLCSVHVEGISETGPETTRPSANTSLAVRVYPSHFREMTSDSLQEHLAAGQRKTLTVQQQGGAERFWLLLRFE